MANGTDETKDEGNGPDNDQHARLPAGATGAIGRRLLPLLVAGGQEVTAMVRLPRSAAEAEQAGATATVADALDAAAVSAAALGARPEAIMHQLTALSARDFGASAALRITGTRDLADAAEAAGTRRFIALSISLGLLPG